MTYLYAYAIVSLCVGVFMIYVWHSKDNQEGGILGALAMILLGMVGWPVFIVMAIAGLRFRRTNNKGR